MDIALIFGIDNDSGELNHQSQSMFFHLIEK